MASTTSTADSASATGSHADASHAGAVPSGPTPWLRPARMAKRRVKDLIDARERSRAATRRKLSARYLHGQGLEIGALHLPLWTPRGTVVRYVDRYSVDGLRAHYPELARLDLVAPDVIADGETLEGVADGSVDFVIANHFIEHTQDPIGTIGAHLRVLREGGVLYLAVPDARETFDRDRPRTAFGHVLEDHREGPAGSRAQHYEEWAAFVDAVDPAEIDSRARDLEARDYSIHFHVWTPDEFLELLVRARLECGLPMRVEEVVRNGNEFVVVVRRA
jgi:SAM-dependent methyltransferase